MRVISGSARGRTITAPKGLVTRPITDRAKEAVFNMLESLGGVRGATVVDLYAGSGSFGLECLSRGADSVVFVDQARSSVESINTNVKRLGFGSQATVIQGSALPALSTLGPADLVFCDPPYADDPWVEVLGHIRADLLVGHADHPIELGERWEELKRRKYGRSHIVIAGIATKYRSEPTPG